MSVSPDTRRDPQEIPADDTRHRDEGSDCEEVSSAEEPAACDEGSGDDSGSLSSGEHGVEEPGTDHGDDSGGPGLIERLAAWQRTKHITDTAMENLLNILVDCA